MNSATCTDNRLQNCPRLRQAFMVPQMRVAPKAAPVVEEKPSNSAKQGVVGLFGQVALQVLFKGLTLAAYPLKRLGGREFESQKISFAH